VDKQHAFHRSRALPLCGGRVRITGGSRLIPSRPGPLSLLVLVSLLHRQTASSLNGAERQSSPCPSTTWLGRRRYIRQRRPPELPLPPTTHSQHLYGLENTCNTCCTTFKPHRRRQLGLPSGLRAHICLLANRNWLPSSSLRQWPLPCCSCGRSSAKIDFGSYD
jgi:hypothetical protein